MLITIDHHTGVPVYRQVMDQVKFHIASGLLKPGEELPATRALSARLEVNPMTISKAYSMLEVEGYVERRRGLPLIVKPMRPEELHDQKLDHLRQSLAPIATMTRQLGIDRAQALKILGQMLDVAIAREEEA